MKRGREKSTDVEWKKVIGRVGETRKESDGNQGVDGWAEMGQEREGGQGVLVFITQKKLFRR